MKFIPNLNHEEKIGHYNLDIKDKKLLYLLSLNSRLSASFIANKIGLSKDSVLYRMKRMEERKIIDSTRTIVNVSLLGYDNFHLFVTLNNPESHIEDEILKELIKHPNVRAILKFHGSYDFEIGFIAKNLSECDKVMKDLVSIMGNHLKYHDLFIITKTLRAGAFPGSFVKGLNFPTIQSKFDTSEKIKLEDKDFQIIKLLREDARKPLIEIAAKTRISSDSIAYRLKNLEKSGVITSYSPVINYSVLGYRIHTLMFSIKQFDTNMEKKVKTFLEGNPHVLWAVKTLGRYDILLYLCTKEEQDYHDFISELRKLLPQQLLRYDSLHAFAEYKYQYAPDCIFSNQL